jgi:FO synthase
VTRVSRRNVETAPVDDPVLDPVLLAQTPAVAAALDRILSGGTATREEAVLFLRSPVENLDALCAAARMIRARGSGRTVSFSPKVFLPLTHLCRDTCGYCTFRTEPAADPRLYMTIEEVLQVARAGQRLGCTEALFTLGERPEQRFPEAREWLRRRGHRTTLSYLREAAAAVLRETTLWPHLNPGTMSRDEMAPLRDVSASMGLMLENTSERLCGPGGPHEHAASKRPRVRLRTMEAAGALRIPFTTGLLIGIGETVEERVDTLLAIRESHARWGHIQEVIVQNFRAKPQTPMAGAVEPGASDVARTAAVARLALGPDMNIQVPPNLTAHGYETYLDAGINDWGGISPLTPDHINPERPWPGLRALRAATEREGHRFRERLAVYPEFATRAEFVDERLRPRVAAFLDADGLVRESHEHWRRW